MARRKPAAPSLEFDTPGDRRRNAPLPPVPVTDPTEADEAPVFVRRPLPAPEGGHYRGPTGDDPTTKAFVSKVSRRAAYKRGTAHAVTEIEAGRAAHGDRYAGGYVAPIETTGQEAT